MPRRASKAVARGGRPSRADALQLRERILLAATELFLAEGYGSTSIEAVARHAGVSKRTLYDRFDDKAMFTHMGGTWGKSQELATIKSGGIWYKKAVVYAVDARIFGNTAILLEDIDLQAAVGEHEVTNPFMVTEVYIKENGKWKLAQLTFSHLLRPVKMNSNKN